MCFSDIEQSYADEIAHAEAVVIGSGAGLAAAATAAEKGVRVIVLEKREKEGGNITMARGFLAAESPAQYRMKIDAKKEQLFKATMGRAHWKVNPRIIKAFIDKSGETVRWFEEMGVVFSDIPHEYHNQQPRVYHIPEGQGLRLVNAMKKKCEDLDVLLYYGTTAKKILTGENGEVTGVLAQKAGRKILIHCSAIVIATGGYSGNRRMLRKHYPFYTKDLRLNGIPNTGDGYAMAVQAGAATEGLGMILAIGPMFRGSLYVHAVAMEANTVWVNRSGERFINEDSEIPSVTSNALNLQPDKISFTLFDDRIKRGFMERGLVKALDPRFPAMTKMIELDRYLQKERENGHVMIASDLKEIAGWIGMDAGRLIHTIDEYNGFCTSGRDDLFYKDQRFLEPLNRPPFYALKCGQAFHCTIGGIKINHHMQVLNKQDTPIPGLFAIGNDAGGWAANNQTLTGTTLSFALNSGRIVGNKLSSFLSDHVV